ncbi:toll/interleukin-1 receptor domain-containing protein [Gorillibacterium sp. CAU 1737]|uniref:toll/interleukin-1 receptor domain-containing protein n=1 Tax=Gorillibacterium sp. CAU 1737 TaxID=3140362 RepID=UPI0032618C3B
MTYFFSHSERDKELTEEIIDLLQLGMNIPSQDIFCSSLGNIPIGDEFPNAIKMKIQSSKVFFCLITPNFLTSKFCLCELGAAWITEKLIIPIIATPSTFSDINALPIRSNQCITSDSYDGFLQLFDKLMNEGLIKNVNLNRFINKLNSYMNNNSASITNDILNYIDIEIGCLGKSKVCIGETREELIAKIGDPDYVDTIGESTFYVYGNITYYFEFDINENSKVLTIGIGGNELTKHEVINILGEPTEDTWSDLDSEWYITYNIGERSLYIGFITDESRIGELDKESDSYYAQYLLATKNSKKVSHIILS